MTVEVIVVVPGLSGDEADDFLPTEGFKGRLGRTFSSSDEVDLLFSFPSSVGSVPKPSIFFFFGGGSLLL